MSVLTLSVHVCFSQSPEQVSALCHVNGARTEAGSSAERVGNGGGGGGGGGGEDGGRREEAKSGGGGRDRKEEGKQGEGGREEGGGRGEEKSGGGGGNHGGGVRKETGRHEAQQPLPTSYAYVMAGGR